MIFGFFSRWKKAGRATGVTGGAGKLCKFDKDGNVVASAAEPDNAMPLYIHTVTLNSNIIVDDVPEAYANIQIINRSAAQLNTWAKLRNAMPTRSDMITMVNGSFEIGGTRPAISCIYRDGTGSGAKIIAEAALGYGQTIPSTYEFTDALTFTPTDSVKMIRGI